MIENRLALAAELGLAPSALDDMPVCEFYLTLAGYAERARQRERG